MALLTTENETDIAIAARTGQPVAVQTSVPVFESPNIAAHSFQEFMFIAQQAYGEILQGNEHFANVLEQAYVEVVQHADGINLTVEELFEFAQLTIEMQIVNIETRLIDIPTGNNEPAAVEQICDAAGGAEQIYNAIIDPSRAPSLALQFEKAGLDNHAAYITTEFNTVFDFNSPAVSAFLRAINVEIKRPEINAVSLEKITALLKKIELMLKQLEQELGPLAEYNIVVIRQLREYFLSCLYSGTRPNLFARVLADALVNNEHALA